MRSSWALFLLIPALAGCTHGELRQSTVRQASSLTELQYQQVLNNLAMFCKNPWALPSHINLRDGSAQIADVGQASILFDAHSGTVSHPGVLGSRTVVEQWGMNPVTNDTELKILQVAYRRALGYPDSLKGDDLQNELANDLAHELKKQTPDLTEYRDKPDRYLEEARAYYLNDSLNNYFVTFDPYLKNKILANITFPYNYRFDIPDRYNANTKVPTNHTFWENMHHVMSVKDKHIIFPCERIGDPDFVASKVNPLDYRQLDDERTLYIPPFPAELRRQVNEVQKDLLKTPTHWFGVGRKHEIPKDACYVGHYQNCYVWVCPEHLKELTDFTLNVLNYASIIKDPGVLTMPGPRFTPASGFPSH